MLNLDKLMTLVENSTAMNEQYEDVYPEMSMLEAAAYLPAMITESQLELAESVNAQAEQVMTIMTESADPRDDLESLTEASLQGIKDRILGFLKKVKEVVMSIINKIAQAINMMVKSNKDILKKYASKIDESKCKNLTIKGYAGKLAMFNPKMNAGVFMDKYAPDQIPESVEGKRAFVEEHKDIEKKNLKEQLVAELTGMSLDKADGNWASEYVSNVLGEVTEIKYGEGMFTFKSVSNAMHDTKQISNLKDEYAKILKDAQKKEKEIAKLKTDAKSVDRKVKHENKDDADRYESSDQHITYSCYTIWLQLYQLAYKCVSQAKNAEVKILQVKQQQAKKMFSKMLKASTGKGSDEE